MSIPAKKELGEAGIAAVVVVIPARDEAGTIEACLDSIAVAAAAWGGPVAVHVGADSCRDATAGLARRHPVGATVIEGDWGGAGAARRHLTDVALDASDPDLSTVWVASTDADSTVSPSWIRRQVEAAGKATDVVLGIVSLAPDTPRDLVARFEAMYLGGDGHAHVHAANLGIRADAYRRAGGWDEWVVVGEDHDLVERARALGLTVGALGDLIVETSGRTRGRVTGGFASSLADLLPPRSGSVRGALAG